MKVSYDAETDTLTMIFGDGVAVAESVNARAGIILDLDTTGEVLSIEIVDTSRRATDARSVDFTASSEA